MNAPAKTPSGMLGCLGFIGILTVLGMMSYACTAMQQSCDNYNIRRAQAKEKEALEAKKRAFEALPAQEHMSEARKAIAARNVPLAHKHLNRIPPTHQGFTETVTLLDNLRATLKTEAEARAKVAEEQNKIRQAAERKRKAEEEKQRKADERRQRAEWRKEGVHIGMTAERVLLSSWGKPESINRTVYSFGVHEQWCYPGYQYLYFEDGILVTIQNNK